jgi:hypothetical protein
MAMNFWYIYQEYKEKVESKPSAIMHILDQIIGSISVIAAHTYTLIYHSNNKIITAVAI